MVVQLCEADQPDACCVRSVTANGNRRIDEATAESDDESPFENSGNQIRDHGFCPFRPAGLFHVGSNRTLFLSLKMDAHRRFQ
jgi:hypothetical protein